jgi:NTP pyrophosphatase (non-canonical NTP hydrolase)
MSVVPVYVAMKIEEYYEKRNLHYPTFDEAMKWAITEVGEVYEVDLVRNPNWVRNNPEDKPEFSAEALAEELGDVIMMIMVAGMVEGVNPLGALLKKMERKMKGDSEG